MLLVLVVRLRGMRIPDLIFTHVGRGQMAAVKSHKGATLASGLTIRILCCDRGESEGDLPTTRSLSTLDVITGPHSPALGPSDIPSADYISKSAGALQAECLTHGSGPTLHLTCLI